MTATMSLDEQRRMFAANRFLAMPLAGTIAWSAIGIAGTQLSVRQAGLFLYVASGMIVWLGIFISRFTGENFLDKTKPKNEFDSLFMHTVVMALMVFAIAFPFALVDGTSVPLSVGILGGLMWIPFSWIINHWVGIFHTAVRTGLIVFTWYAFPHHRFVVVPAAVVATYLATIAILEARWRRNRIGA